MYVRESLSEISIFKLNINFRCAARRNYSGNKGNFSKAARDKRQRYVSRRETLSSKSRVIDFRAGLRRGLDMYQKSCGRIVNRARARFLFLSRAASPRRLKMYPTIEALRQTSEAGVFLIRFHGHEERAWRAVSSRVRRGGARARGRIEIRY